MYISPFYNAEIRLPQESSQGQRLMGRCTKPTLPTKASLLQPQIVDPKCEKENMETVRAKQKFYYDRNAKDLNTLSPGESVRIQVEPDKNKWRKGTITGKMNTRSYEVLCENGQKYRRNSVHIRPSIPLYDPSNKMQSGENVINLPSRLHHRFQMYPDNASSAIQTTAPLP